MIGNKINQTVAALTVLLLAAMLFASCASAGTRRVAPPDGGSEISARGAIGGIADVPREPLFTGNGGAGLRLAVLAPETFGDVPAYLPVHIQGLLNRIFGRYSGISLVERQHLDRIIAEQNLAASGRFSDQDFVSIGNLANVHYILLGNIQRLPGNRFTLQLIVTNPSTGIRRATSPIMEGSLAQFEGRGTLINEVAAYLLTQMGVELTEIGRRSLLAGDSSVVRAELGIARGITAMAIGDEVEALFNITQAITFDPSNIEALSRLNTLSADISGGTVSQRIVNDIHARERWLEVFAETARFFNDHPPFIITFDPNLIQIGETDFARRTATIGMRMALEPSEAGFAALNALLEGLEGTGRRAAWGFSGWPLANTTPRTPGTVVFGGRRSFSYTVDVTLLNENNIRLGTSRIILTTGAIEFASGDTRVRAPVGTVETVRFPNVSAGDLTPSLTIVIDTVNGIPSRELDASGYMRIVTGNLENRMREQTARQEQQARQAQAAQRPMSVGVGFLMDFIRLENDDLMTVPTLIGTVRVYPSLSDNFGLGGFLTGKILFPGGLEWKDPDTGLMTRFTGAGSSSVFGYGVSLGVALSTGTGPVIFVLDAGPVLNYMWATLGMDHSPPLGGITDYSILEFGLGAVVGIRFGGVFEVGASLNYSLLRNDSFRLFGTDRSTEVRSGSTRDGPPVFRLGPYILIGGTF